MSDFSKVVIVCNNRAELGPLESVIAALPGAKVVGLAEELQVGHPTGVIAVGLHYFTAVLRDASVVVLLGDRYETLSAALAAMFLRVKIVHIHGGETTTGSFDNALRHSITHLAEQSGGVHCVATEDAKNRVFELGEGDVIKRIHITGAPGLDGVVGNSARRDSPLILVTYHPETCASDYGVAGVMAMLTALDHSSVRHLHICISRSNYDPGRDKIMEALDQWQVTRMRAEFMDYSHDKYVARMQSAVLVIGNSSAGIIEAPWVGVPSVNIGNRQNGRPMASSVFQGIDSINEALSWKGPWEPIYQGGAAPKIAAVVAGLLDA